MTVDELFLLPNWQASRPTHLPRHPATCCSQQLLSVQPPPERTAHPDGKRAFPEGQRPTRNKGPKRVGLGEGVKGGEGHTLD